MANSSYIDNYKKMKLLSNPINLDTAAEKYIILNPFKPSHFLVEANDTLVFNWHSIDLSVNITMDVGFLLYVNFSVDNIDQRLVYDAIDQFLDSCVNRYGLHLMKKWVFFINYSNVQSFDKTNTIEELILSKVKNAHISYSFEF